MHHHFAPCLSCQSLTIKLKDSMLFQLLHALQEHLEILQHIRPQERLDLEDDISEIQSLVARASSNEAVALVLFKVASLYSDLGQSQQVIDVLEAAHVASGGALNRFLEEQDYCRLITLQTNAYIKEEQTDEAIAQLEMDAAQHLDSRCYLLVAHTVACLLGVHVQVGNYGRALSNIERVCDQISVVLETTQLDDIDGIEARVAMATLQTIRVSLLWLDQQWEAALKVIRSTLEAYRAVTGPEWKKMSLEARCILLEQGVWIALALHTDYDDAIEMVEELESISSARHLVLLDCSLSHLRILVRASFDQCSLEELKREVEAQQQGIMALEMASADNPYPGSLALLNAVGVDGPTGACVLQRQRIRIHQNAQDTKSAVSICNTSLDFAHKSRCLSAQNKSSFTAQWKLVLGTLLVDLNDEEATNVLSPLTDTQNSATKGAAHLQLGRHYWKTGDLFKARLHLQQSYNESLAQPWIDPLRQVCCLYLGRICHAEGQWDQAYAILNDLIDEESPLTLSVTVKKEAYHELATVCNELGLKHDAVKHFQAYLECLDDDLSEGSIRAVLNLATLFVEVGEFDEALEALDALVEVASAEFDEDEEDELALPSLGDNVWYILCLRGVVFMNLNQFEEARDALNAAIHEAEKHSNPSDVDYVMSILLHANARYEQHLEKTSCCPVESANISMEEAVLQACSNTSSFHEPVTPSTQRRKRKSSPLQAKDSGTSLCEPLLRRSLEVPSLAYTSAAIARRSFLARQPRVRPVGFTTQVTEV
eukprot:m.50108 g.50108  ORF g.50108 m.50108 type:complete len:769 (+) comp11133_c1_seq7:923-3229(+)